MSQPGPTDGRPPAADLLAVLAGIVLLAVVAFTPAGAWRPVALVVGLPIVLVVPGYALVAAVFPRSGGAAPTPGSTSWVARLCLSVAGSVVAITVVGVALDFSIWGFQRAAVVVGLAAVTLAAAAVAWVRRRRLTTAEAAGVSLAAVGSRTRSLAVGGGALDAALTVLVLAAALGTVAVVTQDTTAAGDVTEFYILGETESNELVAGSYPSNLTAGEPATVGVGVGTTRESGFRGTVVATLERVAVGETATRVTDTQRLGTFDVAAPAGERTVRRHTVQPTLVGDRLRLTYRLYERGADQPFRRVQLWVSVAPAQ